MTQLLQTIQHTTPLTQSFIGMVIIFVVMSTAMVLAYKFKILRGIGE